MKAALQTRTQIQNRVLLVASILALSIYVTGQPAAVAADDATAAAVKETSEKNVKDKEKEANKEAKKEKAESSASKSSNGKSESKETARPATSSADSKSKVTSTKQEPEKSAKATRFGWRC